MGRKIGTGLYVRTPIHGIHISEGRRKSEQIKDVIAIRSIERNIDMYGFHSIKDISIDTGIKFNRIMRLLPKVVVK